MLLCCKNKGYIISYKNLLLLCYFSKNSITITQTIIYENYYFFITIYALAVFLFKKRTLKNAFFFIIEIGNIIVKSLLFCLTFMVWPFF